jgi:hypothetical protein
MPFLYANTPAMGSKYSNTMFSMIVTARAHLLTSHLEEWQVEQLIQTGQKVLSEELRRSRCRVGPLHDDRGMWREVVDYVPNRTVCIRRTASQEEAFARNARVRVSPEITMKNVTGMMMSNIKRVHRSGFTGTPERDAYDAHPMQFPSLGPPTKTIGIDQIFIFSGSALMRSRCCEHETTSYVIIDGGCELPKTLSKTVFGTTVA